MVLSDLRGVAYGSSGNGTMSAEGGQDAGGVTLIIRIEGRATSDNRLKRHFSVKIGNRTFQSSDYTDEAKAWMQAATLAATVAVRDRGARIPHPRTWQLPLVFDVTWTGQRIDPLNGFKALNDAIMHALEVDDAFFAYTGIRKAKGAQGVTITVRPARDSEALRPQPKNCTPKVQGAPMGGYTLATGVATTRKTSTTRRLPDSTKPAGANLAGLEKIGIAQTAKSRTRTAVN